MSILNIFKSQLSAVIEWKDQNPNTIWYKHPSERDEIINASKLILSPGQGCVLVYEGVIKDILLEEGIYNLKTDNHPFITTISNLRQNFVSEHKLYIYYFKTTTIYNQRWGTASPVKYIDPIYNIPVSLGANGSFAFRLSNVDLFYKSLISNISEVDASYIKETINTNIPQEIITTLAQSSFGYNQIDANLKSLSDGIKSAVIHTFDAIGLELVEFKILGTQFDDKTISRIGEIADIKTQTTVASEAGLSYLELEKLRTLRDAAKNEGGLAAIRASMGIGMELSKNVNIENESNIDDYVTKLQKLNILLKESIISSAETEELKKQILSKL